jgi:hypothetical protein
MRVIRASDPGFSEAEFRNAWSELVQRSQWFSPLATESDIRYQNAFLSGQIAEAKDVSLVICADNGEPLNGLRAFLIKDFDGKESISCMGRPAAYIEAHPTHRESQSAFKQMKKEVESLLQSKLAPELWFRDYAWSGNLSPMSQFLMASGARLTPALTQIIDLTQSEEQISSGIRSSFRSLIKWGLRELNIQVFDARSAAREAFDGFREVHRLAAGRLTRSLETWERQYESILEDEMFLITGHFEGRMVTGGLFKLGKGHAYYAIGASDRDLFEKPLSHAVIWKAMLYAKSRGIRSFEVGDQQFPAFPHPDTSAKEVSISMFKRGFGGETKLVADLYCRVERIESNS